MCSVRIQTSQVTLKPPLQLLNCPDMPWERVGIDLMGPILYQEEQVYLMVVVDHFLKWPEIKVNRKAETHDSHIPGQRLH